MIKSTLRLLAALLLTPLAALHAAEDLPEPPVSWKYPPEMPGASVEVYREVNGIKLNAYIFTPPDHRASDRRPAVLFFFGGGWKGGSPGQFLPQSLYLAARGMVAVPRGARHGRHPVRLPGAEPTRCAPAGLPARCESGDALGS